MIELIYLLVVTHITIVCITVFLHRGQAHRALEFSPVLSHAMRFWLWLTTGMITRVWVAVHRKHHRFTDQPGDPHSPVVYGIARVFFGGVGLYKQAALDKKMVDTYGAGTPDDWIEQNLYTRFNATGILLMLAINVALFSWWGIVIWLIQMAWTPFWAAGFINGVGHWFGYRNGETRDHSRNIVPWGIIVGGEELHNNHHLAPASAKLSRKSWEFDVGWMWIKIFEFFKLVKIRKDTR